MLKIVGISHGEVVDEKILIDENDKITKYGWMLIVLDLLADIGIFCLISKIIKRNTKK